MQDILLNMTKRAFRLMAAVPVNGCLVEFGEYQGAGLSTMAKLARSYLPEMPPIYGFDSFKGMPLTDRPLAGALADFWVI